MRKLLNSLFVTTEEAYLTLEGENVVIKNEGSELGRFPLHILEGIYSFSYAGASPALMGACATRGINMSFHSPNGRFLARISGEANGNVLLRRTQYRVADDPRASNRIARNFLYGKIFNTRWTLERTLRDHPLRVDTSAMERASAQIQNSIPLIKEAETLEQLRGIEGEVASAYFGVFNQMLLNQSEDFRFIGRNRRPPIDRVNAMLSFAYSLLVNNCAAALESSGLDSYVGFLHRDRPGRISLALDLMEELRAPVVDRMVITMINLKQIQQKDFDEKENGAIFLNSEGRKKLLKVWQDRKRETITHPFLKEKMPWGLIPYVQGLLLARYLRDDLDGYPPFLWK